MPDFSSYMLPLWVDFRAQTPRLSCPRDTPIIILGLPQAEDIVSIIFPGRALLHYATRTAPVRSDFTPAPARDETPHGFSSATTRVPRVTFPGFLSLVG